MKAIVFGIFCIFLLSCTQVAPSDDVDLVFCAADTRECPDGSYVSRQGSDCSFAACPSGVTIDCTAEQMAAEVCTKEYRPVCVYTQDGFLTISNSCEACQRGTYYVSGEC